MVPSLPFQPHARTHTHTSDQIIMWNSMVPASLLLKIQEVFDNKGSL